MKQKSFFRFFIILAIAVIFITSYQVLVKSSKDDSIQVEKETSDEEKSDEEDNLYRPEQTVKVEGAKKGITVNERSKEAAVIDDMHLMTHQKVQAEYKTGAIQMTSSNIEGIYKIVTTSTYSRKNELLTILTKWINGNFRTIDYDHNILWKLQGGDTGEATGILTEREEKEFIKNNFE